MDVIRSRSNPLIQEVIAIRDGESAESLFLEGDKLIQEAIKSGYVIEKLLTTDLEFDADIPATRKFQVHTSVFSSLSAFKEPQGILGIASKRVSSWERLFQTSQRPYLVLDGIQDPGNCAAILRSAEAAGCSGVVTTVGTARLFTPKALRGAMGSSLRLPILEHISVDEIVQAFRPHHISFYATSSHADQAPLLYTDPSFHEPVALVFGNESKGISGAWKPYLTGTVRIPMEDGIESLNVGAAAAVLLFELKRRRKSL
jgi:TrmH family RNA methyltransferase